MLLACASHTPQTLVECATHHHRSQFGEDTWLLPTLLLASGRGQLHSQHSFVEIGAYDGTTISNTYLLEKCCNWTGTLIEANPANFAALNSSDRHATKVHAAVCKQAGTINITINGGVFAGVDGVVKSRRAQGRGAAPVPCNSLTSILASAHHPHHIDFMSLDVEGAEAEVLETLDARRIRVIAVESAGRPAQSRQLVAQQLGSAKLIRIPQTVGPNDIWVRSDVEVVEMGPMLFGRNVTHQFANEFAKPFAPHVLRAKLEDVAQKLRL